MRGNRWRARRATRRGGDDQSSVPATKLLDTPAAAAAPQLPSNCSLRAATGNIGATAGGTVCSKAPHCLLCGRLVPMLFLIGSIKTGSTSLWSKLVDLTDKQASLLHMPFPLPLALPLPLPLPLP